MLLFLLGLIYNGLLQFHFEPAASGRLAADRHLLRDRLADLPVHEGAHPGDPGRRDPGRLLGHIDVRAVSGVERPAISRRRPTWPAISTGNICRARSTRRYYGFGDNEGLLSTIPAVATALLGVLAGHWLLSGRGRWIKALGLALAGLACLGVGTLGTGLSRSSRSSGPARTS